MQKRFRSFSIFCLLVAAIMFYSPSFLLAQAADYQLEIGQAQVIASQCEVYSQPDFSASKLEAKYKLGDKVEVVAVDGEFAKINLGDAEGFVYKYYLSQKSSLDVYPIFNATIRKATKIYDINDQATEHIAKKDSRVYLYDGFNDKREFTAVQLVLEDGSLYVGKVKTEDINPDGVSALLIVGITIILAVVTIILSLVFIRKNKKKKNK